MVTTGPGADLVVTGAKLVATCDAERRELAGGWVAVTGGLISAVGGAADPRPAARETLDAAGCLVTPGLVNTHHHMYQNLTRSYAPTVNGTLFEWLSGLYPLWAGLDEEAAYLSAWVALAELALGGCTTSTDHLYVAPAGGGDLWSAEIAAAREVGLRFHPTRGSMTISAKDGGLPPDSVVQDDDEVLADCERLVAAHHDPAWGAMVRVALAPCSPFSVSPELMLRTAELAERLDVRLHTHLAEDPDEDSYCLEHFGRRPVEQYEEVGWLTPRSWVAHCVYPNEAEAARLGAAGVGVAHCPSSNMLLAGGGFAPVRELRAAGSPVGLGCDGSSSSDTSSLWLEARAALTARQAAARARGHDRAGGARHRHPRRRRLPRQGRGNRPAQRRCRRGPRVLAAGGPGVRRGAHRPGGGLAALRAHRRAAHRGRRAGDRPRRHPHRARRRPDPGQARGRRRAHPAAGFLTWRGRAAKYRAVAGCAAFAAGRVPRHVPPGVRGRAPEGTRSPQPRPRD